MNPPPDTLATGRPRALLTATAGLLLTLVVAVALAGGRPLGLDQAVEAIVEPWRSEGTRRVALVLGQLGAGAVLYPLLALQAWQCRGRGWRTALLPLAILGLAQTLSVVLLAPVSRPGLGEAGFDLSSGRTSAAVLGWGLLAAGYGLSTRRAYALGLCLGGVVGFSRLLLSQHWATDVLAGLGLGLLVLLVVTPWLRRPVPGINRDAGLRRRPASGWQHRRWAWTLPAFAALVPLIPPLFEPASHRLIDLAVYVGSGGVAGIGSDVYAYRTPQGLPFTYPPFAALLAEPLSRIPLLLVQIGWTAATLAALVAVARIAMRPVTVRIGLAPTVALLLISNPVRSHLRFGQIGIFLVLLVALDLLREPPAHPRWSGAGVGLAAALKLTPAVYLPWLLVTASRERVRGTMLWAAVATLAGLLLLWPSSPTWLSSALWDSSRFGGNAWPGNQSVRGMLLRSGLPEQAAERVWLLAALLLLVVGTCGAVRLERAGLRLAAVGTLAATSVAVSPISWQHHLVWLVLPLSALVAAERHRLAIGWAVLLTLPVTTVGTMLDIPVVGALIVDLCGLSAVAAVLLLPRLVRRAAPAVPAELSPARPVAPARSAG